MMTEKGLLRKAMFSFVLIIFVLLSGAPCWSISDQPVSFVFVVDSSKESAAPVSDYKDGDKKTTILAAVRKALHDVIANEELIKDGSKVSFVSFSTEARENDKWPIYINKESRPKLMALIDNEKSLVASQSDFRYQAGGIQKALTRAQDFRLNSDPCSSTFIILLLSGSDHPPENSVFDIPLQAEKIKNQRDQATARIGIDPWHLSVVGLKKLPPDAVETPKELADLFKIPYVEAFSQDGKNASQRIYSALLKVLEKQRGSFDRLEEKQNSIFPLVDFGTASGAGIAEGSFDVVMRSCTFEKITSIGDDSKNAPKDYWQSVIETAKVKYKETTIETVSSLPPDTIVVTPLARELEFRPKVGAGGFHSPLELTLRLKAFAKPGCPQGTYVGRLKLTSSASVPDSIPYVVSVPARISPTEDMARISVKRRGLLFKEDTPSSINLSLCLSQGAKVESSYTIEARVPMARNEQSGAALEDVSFNKGKPVSATLDPSKKTSVDLVIPLMVPASKDPGLYEGSIEFKITGPEELAKPEKMPLEITVQESDSERYAPITIPTACLAALIAIVLIIKKTRRRK